MTDIVQFHGVSHRYDDGGNALCNDNNPCTGDVCRGTAGCSNTGTDGADASCDQVTDSSLCPLPNGQFRLIELQDPTFSAIQNKTVMNDYIVNATLWMGGSYRTITGTAGRTNPGFAIFMVDGVNKYQLHYHFWEDRLASGFVTRTGYARNGVHAVRR